MNNTIFTDFQLGDRKLSSFGGVLYNENGFAQLSLAPSVTFSTDDLPGVDGLITYSSKYDPRIIDLNIYIENRNFNKDEFINWISAKEERYFNYVGDNKKIKVMRQNQLDMSIYNESQGTMTVSFIAHNPYFELITPNNFVQNTPSVNQVYTFNNVGNTKSKPVLFLQYNGTIKNLRFSINDIEYNIANITSDIYINSEYETVYNFVSGIKVNRIGEFKCTKEGYFKFTFPELNVGSNTFKLLSGGLNKITINCNSKFK